MLPCVQPSLATNATEPDAFLIVRPDWLFLRAGAFGPSVAFHSTCIKSIQLLKGHNIFKRVGDLIQCASAIGDMNLPAAFLVNHWAGGNASRKWTVGVGWYFACRFRCEALVSSA